MHEMLIVDDQIYLADDLSQMFPWQELGIDRVHTAYTAYEALEIFQSHPIDIVISDIRMPGMSGLELVEEIGRTSKMTRCILVSGYSDFEYAQKAIQSKICRYLLKPAADDEVLDAVRGAIAELEAEWHELNSRQRMEQVLRENLPKLKENFLLDLLNGKRLSEERLVQKLQLLGLPLTVSQPYCLMLIRMEDYFDQYDPESTALLEYAIFNMAQEIFGSTFRIVCCKDIHDYLVVLLAMPQESAVKPEGPGSQEMMEQLAGQLQHNVKLYLKGTISLLLSQWTTNLQHVAALYQKALYSFRQQIGGEREFLLSSPEEREPGKAQSISRLYEPPTLVHLLEAGQWDNVRAKLDGIFQELAEDWNDSHEHILETYLSIASAFTYIIHKSNRWLSQVLQQDYEKLVNAPQFHTINQLRDWAFRTLDQFTGSLSEEMKASRSTIIKQVHEYVSGHLGEATLPSIAAHVYLNPSYLSKIYKMETGEGISDFMYRLRMDRAAHLLIQSGDKIYEIAQSLGYMKTSYFIKLFKEKFGVTPQEYRDQVNR